MEGNILHCLGIVSHSKHFPAVFNLNTKVFDKEKLKKDITGV
jgi:hypothetical protein